MNNGRAMEEATTSRRRRLSGGDAVTLYVGLSLLALMIIMVVTLLLPSSASAQDKWTVVPFSHRGVEADVAITFKELLQNQISSRNRAVFVDADGVASCADVPCAQKAGASAGSDVVLYGSLNSLGSNIIATATVVDVHSGNVLSNQKITVNRVEDLESAAERIARAILTGSTTEETAELGNITEKEVTPDKRREGDSGIALRVGVLAPLGESYGDGTPGVLTEISYWYETRNFAIEPRLGFRFDAETDEGQYFETALDVGAYYIVGLGDFTPFLGGGAGLRLIAEERTETVQTGSVLVATQDQLLDDEAFGAAVFARAGILLFRTYTLRVAVTADYNITFVTLNERSNPQNITAGIAVMF